MIRQEVTIGARTFALNHDTGLAYLLRGPSLPNDGPGRAQIRGLLPARAGGVEKTLGWRLVDEAWVHGEVGNDPAERRERRCETGRFPEVVFSMGLPGAGKSTVLKREGLSTTHKVIDSDEIAKYLPGYDPKVPERTHEAAKAIAAKEWQQALAAGTGMWVVDGTGTSTVTMIRRIRAAKRAGFYVRMFYVKTSLATALKRNKARARTVPESVIYEKANEIEEAAAYLMDEVDCFIQVNND